ncbi:MAG: hypothetical protein KatS3mg108_0340 [Isosphaeraceae bacterium]|nr:MAG: hypothetical protein KatS3mg108_0340 [Isosphaeraceae bacterium]
MTRPRLTRALIWSLLFLIATLAGAITFAYTYITDSDTLVALINVHLPRYLPGCQLRVDRAQLRPWIGQFDVTQATLFQPIDGRRFPTARLPWIQVKCDLQRLWKGVLEPREITVAQPSLRLVRRADGSWNVQGLLADPWPETAHVRPVVRVTRGLVEIVEDGQSTMIFHDVELLLEPLGEDGLFRLSGSAQGDLVDRVQIEGTLNTRAGQLALGRASIDGLDLSSKLRGRLPQPWRDALAASGLESGTLDIEADELVCDRRGLIRHRLQIQLHGGTWGPPLPVPLGDVVGAASLEDGRLRVNWLEGRFGRTRLQVHSAMLDLNAPNPLDAPLAADLSVLDLEVDARLKPHLPAALAPLWDEWAPPDRDRLGRINLRARLGRAAPNAALVHDIIIDLVDVSVRYVHFPMPLERLRGRLVCRGDQLQIERVETIVGGQPLVLKGTVGSLGPDPDVDLNITAGSLPLGDESPFLTALPPEIRALVAQFHPTGSIRGTARLRRSPQGSPPTDSPPWDDFRVEALIDLNDDCAIRWDGLPYPVRRLTGRLEIHPNGCTFTEMRGENNMARITASGRVELVAPGQYAGDIRLNAERLPFDQQLRDALPAEWRATWGLLNPVGTSRVEAHVVAGWPDRPDRTRLTITIARHDETRVKLRLLPVPGTPGVEPGQAIEMPAMQDVVGRFDFDNGVVTLRDVAFTFREAPVTVRGGRVHLRDTGQFDLRVEDLRVDRLRLDAELRRIMPPRLAEFARQLDEAKPFSFGGNLTIAWSGLADEPAVCSWDNGRVFFQDNALAAGLSVHHVHGQMTGITGRSDGRGLTLAGQLELDSFIVAEQQVSLLRTPIALSEGRLSLPAIEASFLGGSLQGQAEISLNGTPEYHAWARVEAADLARFTQTIPGRQDLAGKISGSVELSGVGTDLRRLNGSGQASLRDGDLGKLPWFLRLISPLDLARDGRRPAFDRAELAFRIQDGQARLDPIRITGDTLSLHGAGTISPQAEIDFEFTPVYGGQDRGRLAALTRQASGQVFLITARGPLGTPRIGVTVLPGPTRRVLELVRGITNNADKPIGPPAPRRRSLTSPRLNR